MAGNLPQPPNPVSRQSGNKEKANWASPFQPLGGNRLAEKQHFSITSLLDSGLYSDLTIKCGHDIHEVHKAIVCSASPFFKAAVKYLPAEGPLADQIDLSEHDPIAVSLAVMFFYHWEYNNNRTFYTHHSDTLNYFDPMHYSPENLLHHFRVFMLADFLQLDNLKTLAVNKFKAAVSKPWLCTTPEFFKVAEMAYTTPTSRDQKVQTVIATAIRSNTTIVKMGEFKYLCRTTGLVDVALDLLVELQEKVRIQDGERQSNSNPGDLKARLAKMKF